MDERTDKPTEEKHQWQKTKEGWYDNLNISVRTLDIIIGLGIAGLVIVFLMIFRDAGIL